MLNQINKLGLVGYLPLLFATAMSFDAPGSGRHWTHWLFVVSSVMIGPLSLIGYKTTYRWAGLFGIALFVFSIMILEIVCNGSFVCK